MIFQEALSGAEEDALFTGINNGEEAVKLLTADNAHVPDYIFLDLNMPRLNGKQCLEKIRKIPSMRTVPVIIYSTSTLENDREETKALGANYFLVKPNHFTELQHALKAILAGDFSSDIILTDRQTQ